VLCGDAQKQRWFVGCKVGNVSYREWCDVVFTDNDKFESEVKARASKYNQSGPVKRKPSPTDLPSAPEDSDGDAESPERKARGKRSDGAATRKASPKKRRKRAAVVEADNEEDEDEESSEEEGGSEEEGDSGEEGNDDEVEAEESKKRGKKRKSDQVSFPRRFLVCFNTVDFLFIRGGLSTFWCTCGFVGCFGQSHFCECVCVIFRV